MRRKTLAAAVLICLILLATATVAYGNVKSWYEWKVDPATGKPDRSLQIWCGGEVGAEWQGYLQQAIANWNNANTGWKLEIVKDIEKADVTFHQASIPPRKNGAVPAAECRTDFDGTTGEVIGATITMNTDLPWGKSGDDNYDPVKTIKHELGHTMRLDHSDWGNLMDTIVHAGDHYCPPNSDDVAEAKDAFQFNVERNNILPEEPGQSHIMAGEDASLTLNNEELWHIPTEPCVLPLSGIMLPGPTAVPEGLERIVAAAGIFPLGAEFSKPCILTLRCPPGSISGSAMIGELHFNVLPPLDMAGMRPVQWFADDGVCCSGSVSGGCWQEADITASYDAESGMATLMVPGGGMYGLAAPVLEQPPAQPVPAFTDLGPSTPPMAGRALTELKAMDIYRGYPDGSAGLDRNLTRLEFFTLAVRIAGGEADAVVQSSKRPPFVDDIPTWGWGYVNQALALGLTTGYPDGTFQPQRNVTGNEAVTVLVRLLGTVEVTLANAKPWPTGYIEVATELGLFGDLELLLGSGPGAWFGRAITRAEMAVVTRSGLWTTLRHAEDGSLIEGPSLAASDGWWQATVTVLAVSEDGRRGLLARPVTIPAGEVIRLDVAERLYVAPGVEMPAVVADLGDSGGGDDGGGGAGAAGSNTVIVLGHGCVVHAITGSEVE